MNRESQARFVAVLLFLLTVAAVVFAGFNFQKERESARRPTTGCGGWSTTAAWWRTGLTPTGRGRKRGIKADDQLVSVNGQEIKSTPGLVRQLYRTGRLVESDLFADAAVGARWIRSVILSSGRPLAEQSGCG